MDEKMMKALVAAGAIKKINIVGNGARFHIEANTSSVTQVLTWVTLDAAAKWVRGLGVGTANINLARWQPGQRGLQI